MHRIYVINQDIDIDKGKMRVQMYTIQWNVVRVRNIFQRNHKNTGREREAEKMAKQKQDKICIMAQHVILKYKICMRAKLMPMEWAYFITKDMRIKKNQK